MKTHCISLCIILLIAGISGVSAQQEISFSYLEQTFMVVPVRINGSVTKQFILDTGIGLNLISESLCRQLDCKIESEHSGKRMWGQEIRIPMSVMTFLMLK